MKTRFGATAALTAALACAAFAGTAQAAPVTVHVRVEGITKTLVDGNFTTDVHPVQGDATGPHPCDGTNGGASMTPGPTATGALDDALKKSGLTFAATWTPSLSDFFFDRIGPDSDSASQFWGYAVNGVQPEVGGCQRKVSNGDDVVYAYDIFTKKHVLKLTGPKRVKVGKTFSVKVTDEGTGAPVPAVSVGGKKTNRKGIAKLSYRTVGTKRLKARRPNSVRSDQWLVKVLSRG